jgi:hypothetical protein
MAAPPYAQTVQEISGGDATPEQLCHKWGPYEDGMDWRGWGHWSLAYIQGFLECYSKHTKREHGTFSKPAEWYVKAITDWYGLEEGHPEVINVSRRYDKIPEVLFRFRDGSSR